MGIRRFKETGLEYRNTAFQTQQKLRTLFAQRHRVQLFLKHLARD